MFKNRLSNLRSYNDKIEGGLDTLHVYYNVFVKTSTAKLY